MLFTLRTRPLLTVHLEITEFHQLFSFNIQQISHQTNKKLNHHLHKTQLKTYDFVSAVLLLIFAHKQWYHSLQESHSTHFLDWGCSQLLSMHFPSPRKQNVEDGYQCAYRNRNSLLVKHKINEQLTIPNRAFRYCSIWILNRAFRYCSIWIPNRAFRYCSICASGKAKIYKHYYNNLLAWMWYTPWLLIEPTAYI